MIRSAPIADWLNLGELECDPFPAWERMRAEGGIHWVPAVGRYFITAYNTAHEAILDQATFSADVHDSIQVRAWGHSFARRDDPAHYWERQAWGPSFRPGVVLGAWTAVFRRNASRCADELIARGPGADLVWDFAALYASENLRAILGFHNATQMDLQRWSQHLLDAISNYSNDQSVAARGRQASAEVDAALDEMMKWHAAQANPSDQSLVASLLRPSAAALSLDQIRANLKATIAGGMNEPRDAFGVAAWAALNHPAQRRLVEADPSLWSTAFEEAIRLHTPVGALTRQVTRDAVLSGVALHAGAKVAICVDSANRDESIWVNASSFDIGRQSRPHLAFGKGAHSCIGSSVARAANANVALPLIFSRLRGLAIDPERKAEMGGWPFRGMVSLPVVWSGTRLAATTGRGSRPAGIGVSAPAVAIVGAGPSGCFTAQAIRRAFPSARIDVFERLPVPYGLVRYGVAADHQGTKSVTRQFERLFTHDGVRFHGNVALGRDVDLVSLRAAFDAVVLATGVHADAPLGIPGAGLPGVLGSGRLTRALNGYPDAEPLPSLGREVVVIGHGNVAVDVVRLLTRDRPGLAGSDVRDDVRDRLVSHLRTLHVVGRSPFADAKFDAVLVRELATMRGVSHTVHGLDACGMPPGKDARVDALRTLAQLSFDDADVHVEWWFGLTPIEIEHDLGHPTAMHGGPRAPHAFSDAEGAPTSSGCPFADPRPASPNAGRVCAVHFADPDGVHTRLHADTVVTAIGFRSDGETPVDPGSHATGRVEPGLYVAGWLRRGPHGTIPTHRDDARQLARLVRDDLAAGGHSATKPGHVALGELPGVVDFDGWRRIDRHETTAAARGRVRAKLSSHAKLVAAARDETTELPPIEPDGRGCQLPALMVDRPVTIAYGTETGTAELVAHELRAQLASAPHVDVIELADLLPERIDPERFHIVICSTYGDGELPTNARVFREALITERPNLAGVHYAVFGLGDRSYASTYSRGSELLDETLAELGATRIGEYGRHDASGAAEVTELATEWLAGVLAELRAGRPR